MNLFKRPKPVELNRIQLAPPPVNYDLAAAQQERDAAIEALKESQRREDKLRVDLAIREQAGRDRVVSDLEGFLLSKVEEGQVTHAAKAAIMRLVDHVGVRSMDLAKGSELTDIVRSIVLNLAVAVPMGRTVVRLAKDDSIRDLQAKAGIPLTKDEVSVPVQEIGG